MSEQTAEEREFARLKSVGRKLLGHEWEFLRGVPSMKFLPPEGPPEIAFAGRSNVGKSSLINALTQSKGLARTSNTPGRTQELNYFVPVAPDGASFDDGIPPLTLVDMPGYGYAKAPVEVVERWTKLVFSYLRGRSTLRRVFVLIDARHGVKPIDNETFDLLDKAACSYQLVLTKGDKLKPGQLERVIAETRDAIGKRPAAFPEIIVTSSEKGNGIDDLKAAIAFAIGK